jgi:hypothetical protein
LYVIRGTTVEMRLNDFQGGFLGVAPPWKRHLWGIAHAMLSSSLSLKAEGNTQRSTSNVKMLAAESLSE